MGHGLRGVLSATLKECANHCIYDPKCHSFEHCVTKCSLGSPVLPENNQCILTEKIHPDTDTNKIATLKLDLSIGSVFASAVHHVLERDDGGAQVHGAQRRRYSHEAPRGTPGGYINMVRNNR